ncbi:hypothetical protein D3C75_1051660 [compost metagenome]
MGAGGAIPARRDAEESAEGAVEGGFGFIAGALGDVFQWRIGAGEVGGCALHADALDGGGDGFSEHGAVDAVEVIGRQARQVCELVQIWRGVWVGG